MEILNEQERRDALHHILSDLSETQDVLKDRDSRNGYFLRFEEIYHNVDTDNFRHFYSDIFAWLSLIDSEDTRGNLDILAQNMQTIKDNYLPMNRDKNNKLINIRKEIIKLYDHTNLDISRINYTKRITGETKSELSHAKSLIADLQERLKKSEEERDAAITGLKEASTQLKEEVRDSQKKMQNEYITILGIFAAIVLAFTSGITFSSSVLENIDKPSIYRLLAVIFILGFIILNLVWSLIDFLRDINTDTTRKWGLVIVANVLLIVGMLLTFCAYRSHWLDNDPALSNSHTVSENKSGH